MHSSQRVKAIEPSPIRRIIDLTESKPDVIGLHAGEPDFATPQHIIEAEARGLRDGYTHYTHGAGLIELREAISRKLREENGIDADPRTEITVTRGGFAAIFATVQATINPGDEVIILQPSWPSYRGFVRLAGGVPVTIPLDGPEFEPNPVEVERHVTTKTKMIIVSSPNNPAGAVYSRECLLDLARLAKEHAMFILSDEVYEKIVFDDNEHFSIASCPEFEDNTITVNSFSKTYAMTGWRVGYVVANQSTASDIRKIHGHMVSCAPACAQKAALEALSGSQKCVDEMVEEYRRRRNMILSGLNEIDGFSCSPPEGTFYAFPDVSELAIPSTKIAEELLLQARLACIPGSSFGNSGEGYIRFSFAASQQNIEEAISRTRFWRSRRP